MLLGLIEKLHLPHRYAYSGDEEFDKDDTLTLIKPASIPSSDIRSPSDSRPLQDRSLQDSKGMSNDESEEEKTA